MGGALRVEVKKSKTVGTRGYLIDFKSFDSKR
jgi:hypothetical protein